MFMFSASLLFVYIGQNSVFATSCNVQLSYHRRQLQTGHQNSRAKSSFLIFSVTRLSVSYSKRSTKHADLQLIFTITLPIEKTAIQFTITLKKKMTTDQPNHNIVVVVESYPVLQ